MSCHAVVARSVERLSLCTSIPVEQTVRVARAFRDEVVRIFNRLAEGRYSVALTGCLENGAPQPGHDHLYYLPRPSDRPGFLDHLAVYVPNGHLNALELDALLSVEHIRLRPDDTSPITVVAEAVFNDETRQLTASRLWYSRTPLVIPEHLQRNQRHALLTTWVTQIFANAGGPQGFIINGKPRRATVSVHRYVRGVAGSRKIEFSGRWGHELQIDFCQPVALSKPAFGKDAHFGLGQFEPCAD